MFFRKKTDRSEAEVTPVPVVTDLDSDGISEIVMVTKDGTLKTLRAPTHDSTGTQLPELTVVNATRLPLDPDEDGMTSFPVVLEAGFIAEYQSMMQVRKQVRNIVVLSLFRRRFFSQRRGLVPYVTPVVIVVVIAVHMGAPPNPYWLSAK